MATLTYVFDPYCASSTPGARAMLSLWRSHGALLRFTTAHAGDASSRLGLGPDSERSARAFSALRAAAPHLEVPLMFELHRARGERLGRRVLTDIAGRVGLDPALVFEQLRHPGASDRGRAELARARSLQLGKPPTLLFEADNIVTSLPLDEGPLAAIIAPMTLVAS